MVILTALTLTWAGVREAGAQEPPPARNRVFVEALGHGIVYSINYGRDVADALAVRAGVGGLSAEGAEYFIAFGILEGFIREGRHSFHLGAGPGLVWFKDVWFLESEDELHPYGTLSLGYEYRPNPRGIFVRVAFTPVFTDEEFAPWFGLGVGGAF